MNTSPMANLAQNLAPQAPPPLTGFPKPPTAYKLFCQKHHTEFSSKCPGGAAKDLLRIMRNAWKILPENEKEYFKMEAERLRKIYQEKQATAAAAYLNHPSWQFQPAMFQPQTRTVTPPFWEEFKLFEGQKYEDWNQCSPTLSVSDAEWKKAIDSLELC